MRTDMKGLRQAHTHAHTHIDTDTHTCMNTYIYIKILTIQYFPLVLVSSFWKGQTFTHRIWGVRHKEERKGKLDEEAIPVRYRSVPLAGVL